MGYYQGEIDYYRHTGGGYGGTHNGIVISMLILSPYHQHHHYVYKYPGHCYLQIQSQYPLDYSRKAPFQFSSCYAECFRNLNGDVTMPPCHHVTVGSLASKGIDWHTGNETSNFNQTGDYTTELIVPQTLQWLKARGEVTRTLSRNQPTNCGRHSA